MEPVKVRIADGRADITLSRPEVHNAIDWATFDALADAATAVAAEPGVRVVVVSGEGPSFCSGIDTNVFGATAFDDLPATIARAQAGYRALAACPVPTVAALKGHVYGAGLQLALACDLRVAEPDTRLGLLEARYGLIPDLGGTALLPALVGPGRAKKMMWLAEKIDATEAFRIGLVEELVEPGTLDEAVGELARRLAAGPPRVVREVKRLVGAAAASSFERAMDDVAAAQREVMMSSDLAEALTAFIERREPRFTGA